MIPKIEDVNTDGKILISELQKILGNSNTPTRHFRYYLKAHGFLTESDMQDVKLICTSYKRDSLISKELAQKIAENFDKRKGRRKNE